jgi:hypothetical protein
MLLLIADFQDSNIGGLAVELSLARVETATEIGCGKKRGKNHPTSPTLNSVVNRFS